MATTPGRAAQQEAGYADAALTRKASTAWIEAELGTGEFAKVYVFRLFRVPPFPLSVTS